MTAVSGRDRRRSGDPTLFRRVLCRLSYPAVSAGCRTSFAVLTGFEPAASALTGRRALQTAPQDLVNRSSDTAEPRCTPRGVRIPVTAVKGRRPRPLDDGGPFHLRGWHRSSVAAALSGGCGPCFATVPAMSRAVVAGVASISVALAGCSGGGSAIHPFGAAPACPLLAQLARTGQIVAARRRVGPGHVRRDAAVRGRQLCAHGASGCGRRCRRACGPTSTA